MAAWDPNTHRPNLKAINGGSQITSNTPITADMFNTIVNMLIFLRNRRQT